MVSNACSTISGVYKPPRKEANRQTGKHLSPALFFKKILCDALRSQWFIRCQRFLVDAVASAVQMAVSRSCSVADVAARAGVIAWHFIFTKRQGKFFPTINRSGMIDAMCQRFVEIVGLFDDAFDGFNVGWRVAPGQIQAICFIRGDEACFLSASVAQASATPAVMMSMPSISVSSMSCSICSASLMPSRLPMA